MGGCLSSKHEVTVNPAAEPGGAAREERGVRFFSSSRLSQAALAVQEKARTGGSGRKEQDAEEEKAPTAEQTTMSFRLSNLHKFLEGEQVAAGWPAWLSSVAGEAIQGWVPLKADSYETLEKIGQGTYSSVFRAREISTGKIVALKKVRFDNFDSESVRFMAREIQILRRLDHPNVIKLEGLVTSRLSCSIYLVFEYMEHDLAGLASCPEIKLTEPQIKCYMKQLLSGLEHCHSMGIMHRDIKCSNLLVNNQGILKIADFGLANFARVGRKQPLTSRVVTLWYRPPELLLGSTDYGPSIDMWSAGCVLAELLLGKPVLQGRTEVEQLHKIFKLCGSPSDEYWKKSKLPHATIFKPHHPYESCLKERCQGLPDCAFGLVENLLSVEPNRRLSASSALQAEFFTAAPLACDPSSLPSYPPNKEIDAKTREQLRRRRMNSAGRRPQEASRAPRAWKLPQEADNESVADPGKTVKSGNPRQRASGDSKFSIDRHPKRSPEESIPFSGPLLVPPSDFAWAKKPRDNSEAWLRSSSISKSRGLDSIPQMNGVEIKPKAGKEVRQRPRSREGSEMKGCKLDRQDSSETLRPRHNRLENSERVEYSGPLLYKSHKMDELLQKNEREIRKIFRRNWFNRGQKT
ncbi:protein IMPAIRED IN BABA-INDUCED STERILITY 1-like isoform X2 [Wolffia australiana]